MIVIKLFKNRITGRYFYHHPKKWFTIVVFPSIKDAVSHFLYENYGFELMMFSILIKDFEGIEIEVSQKRIDLNPFFKSYRVVARLDVAGLEMNTPKGFAKEENE